MWTFATKMLLALILLDPLRVFVILDLLATVLFVKVRRVLMIHHVYNIITIQTIQFLAKIELMKTPVREYLASD